MADPGWRQDLPVTLVEQLKAKVLPVTLVEQLKAKV